MRDSVVGEGAPAQPGGVRVDAVGLSQRVGKNRTILQNVSVTARPGELVAIAGASGSGKTTLLNALAAARGPAAGSVRYDGADLYANLATLRYCLGYVPQDDIIHRELPLVRTLGYAARLRMPKDTRAADIDTAVRSVLDVLGLAGVADVRVGALSGGERKRASIAVELLTRPRVFFLDEPTSGLDPATAADLVRLLRQMADGGTTVVFTTHRPADISLCDQVWMLVPGGHLAFAGPPGQAPGYAKLPTPAGPPGQAVGYAELPTPAGTSHETAPMSAFAEEWHVPAAATSFTARYRPPDPLPAPGQVCDRPVGGLGVPAPDGFSDPPAVFGEVCDRPVGGFGVSAPGGSSDVPPALAMPSSSPARRERGALRQWALLSLRGLDILGHNRLTVAILAGAPITVIMMFVVLFRPGAFSYAHPSPGATAMIMFWVAFGAFFFGLTYGLLQICNELPVLRRERLVVVRIGPYLLSKIAVLLPLLAIVNAATLAVLRLLDRLPASGFGSMFITLTLSSLAALALGLLASAAVNEPSQATLTMPMLCFPQVLFSGAILPVPVMAPAGKVISYGMSNRWTYEALGRAAGLNGLWARGRSPLGPPLLASYGTTFAGSAGVSWAILTGFALLFLAATHVVLARKTAT